MAAQTRLKMNPVHFRRPERIDAEFGGTASRVPSRPRWHRRYQTPLNSGLGGGTGDVPHAASTWVERSSEPNPTNESRRTAGLQLRKAQPVSP
jgi:hypothetical protein